MSAGLVGAVGLLADLLQGAAALTSAASTVSAVILAAQREGRDLTDADWLLIDTADQTARTGLQAEIDRQKGGT